MNHAEMYTYPVTADIKERVIDLLLQDFPTTEVADRMCMPRAVVRRILSKIDWRHQFELLMNSEQDTETPF